MFRTQLEQISEDANKVADADRNSCDRSGLKVKKSCPNCMDLVAWLRYSMLSGMSDVVTMAGNLPSN